MVPCSGAATRLRPSPSSRELRLITADRCEELDAIRDRFEEQYESHTEKLARLLTRRGDRKAAVLNTAQVTAYRRALADTARTLQRMAERDFGRCQDCSSEIPIERLRIRPDLRYCLECQPAISA